MTAPSLIERLEGALDALSSRSAEVCNRLSMGRSTRGELRDRLRDATDDARLLVIESRRARKDTL